VLICGDCSTPNNDGESFCGNCGAYLVWQRERDDAGNKGPADVAKSRTDPGTVKETVLMPKLPPPPDRAPRRAHDAGDKTGTVLRTPPSGARTTTGTQEPFPTIITAQKRADSVSAGGKHTEETNAGLGEVKPGRPANPVPDSPPPQRDEIAPAPGELVCGRCGAGNKPERSYCRRCATSLKEAAIAPAPPWWRRLITRPARKPPPAGTRPKRKRKRFPFRLVAFLAVVGLAVGAAFFFRTEIADVVNWIQNNLATLMQHAQSITASGWALDPGPDMS
jgi:hypothetical protein